MSEPSKGHVNQRVQIPPKQGLASHLEQTCEADISDDSVEATWEDAAGRNGGR